ncbi:MAG: hypothetical protein JO199_14360, partial [Candidatus Eremiobacteraeota bacterium]|nr:hypothetical protein [Candidatus Eremiobacteraeota bacterium]
TTLLTPNPNTAIPQAIASAAQPQNAAPAAPPLPSAAQPSAQPPAQPSVAPPRAVFVAASVQPAPPAPPGSAPPASTLVNPGGLARAIAASVEGEVSEIGLEARIVATRTAALDISEIVNTPPKPSAVPEPAAPPGAALPPATARTAGALPAAVPPATAPPAGTPSRVPAHVAPVATVPAEPASPEEALLARLRVPLTPVTLAAARIAGSAATALPRALARLDAALASVASTDERAGSLRALIAFVSRLDAANVRALPEQLMAFVANAVDGAEAKIAAIVRQFIAENAPEEAPRALPELPSAPLTSAATAPQPAVPGTPAPAATAAQTPTEASLPLPPTPAAVAQTPAAPALSPEAAAHVAERATALQYDLKATIVALSESLPRGAPPELAPALTEALTAVTAMQLNVLGAQTANPSAITIPLPLFFHESGRPVQLHVSREAPRGGKLDADNFHIAFILDTKTMGTVAVDVQTVGRTVSVDVKTEGAPAASRFRNTLDRLRGRLEQLRYNVANIAASVAPHRFAAAEPATGPQPEADRPKSVLGLDMQA